MAALVKQPLFLSQEKPPGNTSNSRNTVKPVVEGSTGAGPGSVHCLLQKDKILPNRGLELSSTNIQDFREVDQADIFT